MPEAAVDITDYASAFAEVYRRVQPTVDPILSYGNGATPDLETELDSIIVKHKLGTTFVISTAYTYGQIVLPITRNGHRYRVVTGGTSGTTEPTWTLLTGYQVTSGDVVFEEIGRDLPNIYDVRGACREAWELKAAKAAGKNAFLRDGRAEGDDFTYLNCRREAERYRYVGLG